MAVSIKGEQFYILNDSDIKRKSVCNVHISTIYEKSLPRENGINDLRMGSTDRRVLCATCDNNLEKCHGHEGHIVLPAAVYNTLYISYLLKVLRCICPRCYRITSPSLRNNEIYSKTHFNHVTSLLKNKKECGWENCSILLPKYVHIGLSLKREWSTAAKLQMYGEHTTKKRKRNTKTTKTSNRTLKTPLTIEESLRLFNTSFTADDVYELLATINEQDYAKLGINTKYAHPKDLVIRTLVVPPPCIRPTIHFSASTKTRGQDDLTIKLQEIIKLADKESNGDNVSDATREMLQLLVSTYMNNDQTNTSKILSKKRNGQQTRCIISRLKGKKGRIRGNLMGNRCDFSARTVISPGINLDVDQIGVPLEIALQLTKTVIVYSGNLHELTDCVKIGYGMYNGAKSVITKNGKLMSLEYGANSNIRLQLGWKVERYLREGDYVLFNRQPSLRKMSIMAHRVCITNGKTFQLNLCCTGPYNGDFDGDEM